NPSLWTGEAIFSIISLMIRDFAPVEERIARAEARLRRIGNFLLDKSTGMTPIVGEPGLASDVADAEGRDEPNATLDVRRPMPKAWADKARKECEGAIVLLTDGMQRWAAAANLGDEDASRLHEAATDARTAFQTFETRLAL